jgi:uncharacterized membrane protein YjfL (UPF0719 family)
MAIGLLPFVVFAQAPSTFRGAAELIIQMIKGIINILFALLAVGLLYGVVLYFLNSDNEKKRTEIKGYLLWGVIGIIVAFAIWGILALLSQTFGWGPVGIPIISPPS